MATRTDARTASLRSRVPDWTAERGKAEAPDGSAAGRHRCYPLRPKEPSMAVTITTTTRIDAAPEAVWDVLTDFAAYREWNPFMSRIEGRPEVGTRLVVHLTPKGGRGTTFKPVVLAAAPGRELRWLGKLGMGGLLDGEHSFVLTPDVDGTTLLTHGERFTGILVALFSRTLENSRADFEALNTALKQRVETARSR